MRKLSSRPTSILLSLLSFSVLAGCRTGALPAPQNYFTRPFFQVAFNDMLTGCASVYVVDGNSQGWQNTQCNPQVQPFVMTRMLTAAELMQVTTAFSGLPMPPDPSCVSAHTANDTVTTLREATDAADVSWTACVSDGGLLPPYAVAADTLRQFVQTPQTTDD